MSALGSVAALQGKFSRMSALERIADTQQPDFESPRLNVRFHQERTFNSVEKPYIQRQLTANSGHSCDKENAAPGRVLLLQIDLYRAPMLGPQLR